MKTKLILLLVLAALSAGANTFLDSSFNPGSGANGIVETVLSLSTGKILICGNFSSFNGASQSYIARLNSDGSLDSSFNASPSYWVRTMALQSDGKIVIGGFFTSVSGASRNLVARLNADGSLDTSFNPGSGANGVLGVAIDGDADPFVFATAVQSDGKILITGNFTNYNGTDRFGIARLNANGSLDTAFDVGSGLNFASWGRSLHIQNNGQILLTGWFTSYNNQSFNRMVRLNFDGSADTSFNPYFGDLTAVYDALELSSGQYLVCGDSQNTNAFRQSMARLNSGGSFDTSFVGADNDKTESIRLLPNGQILIGGYFSMVDGNRQLNLARLNSDGSYDSTFTPSVNNFVWDVAVQSDGKILIGGGFSTVEGVSRNSIARLLPTDSGVTPPPPPPPSPFQQYAGNYSGLFYNSSSFDSSDAGYFGLLIGPKGGYSATLVLKGVYYSIGGWFPTNAPAQKTISRGSQSPINLSMQFQDTSTLVGTVTIGSLTANITAYKPGFSAASPATRFEGRYTALINGGSGGAPVGDGVLALTVGPLGGVVKAGMLADGTSFSHFGYMSSQGVSPLYISYNNGAAVAMGWININGNVSGSLYWNKGFAALLSISGVPYTPPTGNATAFSSTNLVLTVSGGDLSNPISDNLTLSPPATFTFALLANHFVASMNVNNGVIWGTFYDPAGARRETFLGAVLQNQNAAYGFFGRSGGSLAITSR